MKSVQREMFQDGLAQIPPLVDLYQNGDPVFPTRVIHWLSHTEGMLQRFRHPLESQLAIHRGQIVAAREGAFDEPGLRGRKSITKKTRSTAMASLTEAESAIHGQILQIDEFLAPLERQMAHVLSISSQLNPIEISETNDSLSEKILNEVWNNLVIDSSVQPAYMLLNTTLTRVDRLYLLSQLLSNMLAR